MEKKLITILTLLMLSGCGTGAYYTQSQESPKEACLSDVRTNQAICQLGAMGTGGGGAGSEQWQKCQERAMMQEDRCYARFK